MSEPIKQQTALTLYLVVWDDEVIFDITPEHTGPVAMYASRNEAESFVNGRVGFAIHPVVLALSDLIKDHVFEYWRGPYAVDSRAKWLVWRMFDSGWTDGANTIWTSGFLLSADPIFPIGDESFTESENGEMIAELYASTKDEALQRAADYFGPDRFVETYTESEPPPPWQAKQEAN